jgi:hypothetical protein
MMRQRVVTARHADAPRSSAIDFYGNRRMSPWLAAMVNRSGKPERLSARIKSR